MFKIDPLEDMVTKLLNARDEYAFRTLLARRYRGEFTNRDGAIHGKGEFYKFNVPGGTKLMRVIVDFQKASEKEYSIYTTKDHYETIIYRKTLFFDKYH